jgi:hypothetical protein
MSDVHLGSEPGEGDVLREGEQHGGAGARSEGTGGDAPPTSEREPPETDADVKDSGAPAEGIADPEGTSGAEEGLSPWAPDAYDADADGPTTSTGD